MLEIGIAVAGLAVGMLIGVGMVWDRRFEQGRHHGFAQGRETAQHSDRLEQIRSYM